VSAFAPIADPAHCTIGRNALTGYLGTDEAAWAAWNPTAVVTTYQGPPLHLLIDQARVSARVVPGTHRERERALTG
jgi:S-formylglutathione hydrolase